MLTYESQEYVSKLLTGNGSKVPIPAPGSKAMIWNLLYPNDDILNGGSFINVPNGQLLKKRNFEPLQTSGSSSDLSSQSPSPSQVQRLGMHLRDALH